MNTKKHNRYKVGAWNNDEIKTWWAQIYVGGDVGLTENVCRELCFPKGLCVTIEDVKYVFAGGTENGVRVGLIQYPPFPESEADLLKKAEMVGIKIAEVNYQWSFTIVTPNNTYFFSRRQK